MTEGDRQAFGIWLREHPDLEYADALAANGGVEYRKLAEKIFFSPKFAFRRWLIVSGFGEFLKSRSDKVDTPDHWDDDLEDEPVSDRQNTEDVLKDLWHWMLANEKDLVHN
jgi:hypothetical protein